jgi:hypothetical protein
MKKFMLVVPALLFVSSAFAKPAQLECTGIETPEWSITGTFAGKQIELFDNDAWTKFNYVMDLESYPVQMVYQEEGNEKNSIIVRGTISENDTTTSATYRGSNGTTEEFECTIAQ